MLSVRLPVQRLPGNYWQEVGEGRWGRGHSWASQVALVVKNLPANAGDIRDEDLIPG